MGDREGEPWSLHVEGEGALVRWALLGQGEGCGERAVAREGKLVRVGGLHWPCSENSFLILGRKEEGFQPARGPLRPGAEERKTEIETEQEGGGWIWADRVGGSKDSSSGRRITGQEVPHPVVQPHSFVSLVMTRRPCEAPTSQTLRSGTLPEGE